LGAHAVDIAHRFRSQIADAGLEADAAIGFDEEESVISDGAADVTTHRYANAADLGADSFRVARDSLLPVELLRTLVKRFLDERAGGIKPLPAYFRPELCFSFRTVDTAEGHLIDTELAPGFCEDR